MARCSRLFVLAPAALLACVPPPAKPAEVPSAAPATSQTDEALAARPAPSCQVAVDEFTFRVTFHNPTEVKDSMVGECVDDGWSASERRCVATAASTTDIAECVTTQTRMIAARQDAEGAVGIADCDRVIARYRACIDNALPATIAADTHEALEITIAAWRERIASEPDEGWLDVQLECGALTAALPRTFARYGCDAGR